MTQNQSRWLPIFLSFVVSAGTIFLLFRNVDLDQLWAQLREANVAILLLTLTLYPLGMLARAIRWQQALANPLPYWRGFHILNIGFMFNAVLPFRLGELVPVVLMRREPGQTIGSGISALTLARLFDLVMALFWVGIGLALIPESAALPREITSSLGFFITITILGNLVLLFLPRSHPFLLRIARWVTRPLPDVIGDKLLSLAEDMLGSLRAVSGIGQLLSVLAWSAITWLSYMIFFYVGLLGFFDTVPPLSVGFLVTGFVAIGIAAPSLPGAVGVFQAAAVLALSTAGYDSDVATGYAWVVWISQMVVIIASGIWSLSAMSLSFGEVSRQVRQQEPTIAHPPPPDITP